MTGLGLPKADRPKEVGLSAKRLARVSATFRQNVERNVIPGAVVLVARGGRIAYAEAFGWRDREAKAPMELDSIFRIASMTKPLTSVAAMMLADEGKLQVAAAVADYLPEFADRTVGPDRVAAKRVMTVQDLLRHTSGLTYAGFGDSAVQMIWRDAQLMTEDQTNAEMVAKLASLPLMVEPGTTWEYSMSTSRLQLRRDRPPAVRCARTRARDGLRLRPGLCGAHRRRPMPATWVGRRIFLGGVYGTAFWIDPVEQLVVVAMMLAPERRLYYRHLLCPLVYGALTNPASP